MIAVVRIADEALEAWSSRRRSAGTPPLVVSADIPFGPLRRRLQALGVDAFIVDVTGAGTAELLGTDGARLPGPGHLQYLEPFLQQAQASTGLLEVLLVDRRGVIDAGAIANGFAHPPGDARRRCQERGRPGRPSAAS